MACVCVCVSVCGVGWGMGGGVCGGNGIGGETERKILIHSLIRGKQEERSGASAIQMGRANLIRAPVKAPGSLGQVGVGWGGGVDRSETEACEREGAVAPVTRQQRNEAPLALSAPKPSLARRCAEIGGSDTEMGPGGNGMGRVIIEWSRPGEVECVDLQSL